MKILLITPVNPALPFKTPLPDFQTQNFWLKALKKLKIRVQVFTLTKNQSKLINQLKLKKIIKQFKPDHVFFSAGIDKLFPIKNTVFFCGVPPQQLSLNERWTGMLSKLIVVNCTLRQLQWQKLTKTKIIALPFSAVDPGVFFPQKNKPTYSLVFIGTLFKQRQQQLKEIFKAGVNFKFWGWIPKGTVLLPELKPLYQGEAWGSKAVDIYQKAWAALNLNPQGMKDGANLRTFEIAATKTLQFIDKINPKLYLPQKEVVVFKNPKDLKQKINYFKNHPQKAKTMVNKAYQKTLSQHTFEKRFKKILSLI